MPFNTYIDDKDMIPILLSYDWMIWKDTWTDCPYEIYKNIERTHLHDFKHYKKSRFADKHLSLA
tara:strand:- start:224 stop:415 length:192 start_codon:yes stop_codon:yes gene_type:complete